MFETCEIEDPFPILTSMHDGSHVVLCLGSGCATKLVDTLILLGQENPLVLVPEIM